MLMSFVLDRHTMAHEAARNIRRLRPLRVVLASHDRRFMRVTSYLLDRRGYDVVLAGTTNLVEAAVRARADVVVLEVGASRASSGRALAALAALPSPPAVVTVVDEGHGNDLPGVTALAKWTHIDELAREIETASLRP
jgi:DNA-binding NarL/FixJ family response regulator